MIGSLFARRLDREVGLAAGLAVWLLIILLATLTPFQFVLPEDLENQRRLFFHARTYPGDLTSNVLLFLPWGCLVARLRLLRGGWSRRPILWGLGTSLLLSLGVETLQAFLVARTSSLTDVLANGLGGASGGALGGAWVCGDRLRAWIKRWPRPWLQVGGLLSLGLWLLLCFGTTGRLQQQSQLSNWNPDYAINLGHGGRGFEPWQGQIQQLIIGVDHLPLPLFRYDEGGLRAAVSGRELCDRLWQAKAFYLEAEFSSQSLAPGVATLFSFADDPWHSNWAVLRDGQDLVVQLRSPVTGTYHHRSLPLILPQRLQDQERHHLRLVYRNAVLSASWDGQRQSPVLSLRPDDIFWHYWLPLNFSRYRLSPWGGAIARVLFYGLWALPGGLLLGHLFQSRITFGIALALVSAWLIVWLQQLRPEVVWTDLGIAGICSGWLLLGMATATQWQRSKRGQVL